MNTTLLKVLAVLALLAGTWWHGHRTGAAGVRVDWQAEQLADAEAAEAQRETQRLRARAASLTFETQRGQLQEQLERARAGLRQDLRIPIICPPPGDGHATTLADLPIPAAAVQRLRDAAGQGASGT